MPMVFICVKMHTFLLKVKGIVEMPYQNVKEQFMPIPLGTTNSILMFIFVLTLSNSSAQNYSFYWQKNNHFNIKFL